MIAVLFALPAEGSAFVRDLRAAARAGHLVRGKFAGADVAVLYTGVGAKVCLARLQEFLATEKPTLLVSCGFGGGTANDLQPGDVFVATNYTSPELLDIVRTRLPRAHTGTLYSAGRVIDENADRYRIGRKKNAAAIDMETETIARIVRAANLPLLSLRVISDTPAAPFPAPPEVLFDVEQQRTRVPALLAHMLRNPSAVLRLVRFSKQISLAKKNLGAALGEILPHLAA